MARNKRSTRRSRKPVLWPKIDARARQKAQMITDTQAAIAHALDERGPKGWREDTLLCVKLDKIIEEEVELKLAGVTSPARVSEAMEVRRVVEQAGGSLRLVK